MARIMAIDLGRKRSGIAVTDPLQIIANGLTTVESHKLVDFVLDYLKNEEVELRRAFHLGDGASDHD